MKKSIFLFVLFIKWSSTYAYIGGCGPGLSVKNVTTKYYSFIYYTDTVEVTLDPSDSTLEMGIYFYSGSCIYYQTQWSKNGIPITGNGYKCTTSGSGIYHVSAIIGSPADRQFDVTIIVKSTVTSIDEETGSANQLTIYPNPGFQGLYKLKREKAEGPCNISIFDINGVLMKEMEMNNEEATLDFFDFPKGMYLLKWTSKNGAKGSQKFIYN